jgi:hypothetical protein
VSPERPGAPEAQLSNLPRREGKPASDIDQFQTLLPGPHFLPVPGADRQSSLGLRFLVVNGQNILLDPSSLYQSWPRDVEIWYGNVRVVSSLRSATILHRAEPVNVQTSENALVINRVLKKGRGRNANFTIQKSYSVRWGRLGIGWNIPEGKYQEGSDNAYDEARTGWND